ncbi:hypothetical protein F2Q69_00043120 [Brassica cretica]|uniref:Uncharacterized protein n=1 Tax=Brassica cretica TaxID=69181 RepID=A0A8S9N3S7_BRACR|nr:hypothetical protein F2Q69_00043120 [Brassica cretica]
MSLDRARSLRSDRAVCVLGRNVATKPCACSVDTYRPSLVRTRSLCSDRSVDRAWLELGRYVATEPCTCLVATYDRAWLVHGRFGYMYVVSDNCDRAWLELGRYVATEPCTCLVATYDQAWLVHGRLGYMYVVSDNWYLVHSVRPDPRRVRVSTAQPYRYTVHRPGGPQPHRPGDALPPFTLVPDMSTHPERDFQRVVVDALTAIWARVSRCRCSSRWSVRASSRQQQDHPASAEAPSATRPLMRTTQPCRYTVHRPGGPQLHRPEDALPPFPLVPDMSTHPERDFQRVVVDALTAIWARVSRCRCSSRWSVRASSRQQQDHPASAEAPSATRPLMRTSPHISIPIYL